MWTAATDRDSSRHGSQFLPRRLLDPFRRIDHCPCVRGIARTPRCCHVFFVVVGIVYFVLCPGNCKAHLGVKLSWVFVCDILLLFLLCPGNCKDSEVLSCFCFVFVLFFIVSGALQGHSGLVVVCLLCLFLFCCCAFCTLCSPNGDISHREHSCQESQLQQSRAT